MVIEAKNPGAITRGHLYELGQVRVEFLVVEGAWVSCSLVFGFKQFLLVLSHLREDFVKTATELRISMKLESLLRSRRCSFVLNCFCLSPGYFAMTERAWRASRSFTIGCG